MVKTFDEFESPIGVIRVVMEDGLLHKVELIDEQWIKYVEKNKPLIRDTYACANAVNQLKEYFNGDRKYFNLPLYIEGTEFRKNVWNSLMKIPYGEIRSYYDIAKDIGNVKAVRAVGQANKSNNLPIIIPCHRVISKKNTLIGFVGDNIHIQDLLLKHEGFTLY